MEPTAEFWNDVSERVKNLSGSDRYIKVYRSTHKDRVSDGEAVNMIEPGSDDYENLVELVKSEIEVMSLEARLEKARKKLEMNAEFFWTGIYESTGFEKDDDNLEMNPSTLTVYKYDEEFAPDKVSRFEKLHADNWCKEIILVITNNKAQEYYSAHPGAPWWMKEFATHVINNDSPELCEKILECANNPYEARVARNALESGDFGRFARWFVKVIEVLSIR